MTDLESRSHELLFGVRRSVRYHRRRARFFDMWGKWTNGLNIIFGSTAAAALVGSRAVLGAIAAGLVAVVSTVDIIIGTSSVARDHTDLARRFIELEREMALAKAHSEDQLREFTGKRLAIEADEPDIMGMLDVLCHNDLAKAEGQPRDHLYKVGWLKRLLSQIVNFDTDGLKALPPVENKKLSAQVK